MPARSFPPLDLRSAIVVRIALAQLQVTSNKQQNIEGAVRAIAEAAKAGARLVTLPECFNCPYGTKYFGTYAEPIPGESTAALSRAAKENGVYVVGGSIPERAADKLYNTCTVFNPDGDLIATHRKIHLFDIDIPGKITFKESETLSPGDAPTMFKTDFGHVGVGICYDMRFPELAQLYAEQGCSLLLYPGAFNMTTGPAHWELLQRGRALDNQLFVATASPARNASADYQAWGHSSCVDPWGTVIATTDEQPGLVYADLDMSKVSEVRHNIPIREQKRHDLYRLVVP
ncbi:uncharacterized protein MONBRDRAFT_14153 [Monosiga brevicollis MX1]|uniref:CN hydrolase domain-containing protein n=1 Tax=Monosiga brevicollis TaxID=81824 RepID=A9UP13_MONBE|nr:uncharacterized protein MONBRDRAFT_14153 [Monosiga brevicollis MX1]EDQ92339.1 predicted protein [Monosiga brevicollis MX1]|eukprot:XP_001742101.1 hypothetical protein [Monosiga brevicollis MX1]